MIEYFGDRSTVSIITCTVEWRRIVYQHDEVPNFGNARNLLIGRPRRPETALAGYYISTIEIYSYEAKQFTAHRLVGLAFIDNP
uniref:DUF3444 domain-containing protein n=1 Tax=Rhabditophanes sp. KR3021 TaxID=114890 RepID=A0AC35TTZ5_9BILA